MCAGIMDCFSFVDDIRFIISEMRLAKSTHVQMDSTISSFIQSQTNVAQENPSLTRLNLNATSGIGLNWVHRPPSKFSLRTY